MAGFAPAAAVSAIFRQGSRLILPKPSSSAEPVVLPASVCIRCGEPANGKPVNKMYYWHHPALYLVILVGLLIYVIVALVVRKSMKVSVPLCARHAQRRSTAVTLAWVLPLVGLADVFILPPLKVQGTWVALICAVFMLTGFIIWAIVANPVRPRKIDQFHGEFTGFCETFLQQFPEGIPQAMGMPGQVLAPPPMPR